MIQPRVLLMGILGVGLGTSPALAQLPTQDPTKQCVESYESVQHLRREGKLLAARKEVVACLNDKCPGVLRSDCAQWFNEIERGLPTVVVAARSPEGQDLSKVRVLLDGIPLLESLTGSSVSVDPGPHTFELLSETGLSAAERIVVRQGEKERLLRFVLRASHSSGTSPPQGEPTETQEGSWKKPAGIVSAALGLACLGVGTYFGLRARSKWNERNDHCAAGVCDAQAVEAYDSTRSAALVANITLAAGVLGTGLGTYLLLSSSSEPTKALGNPAVTGVLLGWGGTW